jgi:hypothetical protein
LEKESIGNMESQIKSLTSIPWSTNMGDGRAGKKIKSYVRPVSKVLLKVKLICFLM